MMDRNMSKIIVFIYQKIFYKVSPVAWFSWYRLLCDHGFKSHTCNQGGSIVSSKCVCSSTDMEEVVAAWRRWPHSIFRVGGGIFYTHCGNVLSNGL